jgi:hypothetical protein
MIISDSEYCKTLNFLVPFIYFCKLHIQVVNVTVIRNATLAWFCAGASHLSGEHTDTKSKTIFSSEHNSIYNSSTGSCELMRGMLTGGGRTGSSSSSDSDGAARTSLYHWSVKLVICFLPSRTSWNMKMIPTMIRMTRI